MKFILSLFPFFFLTSFHQIEGGKRFFAQHKKALLWGGTCTIGVFFAYKLLPSHVPQGNFIRNNQPINETIERLLQPIIAQWNIVYNNNVTWNPLALVLSVYTFCSNSYDFYTKKNVSNAILLLILRHIALGKGATINEYQNFEHLDDNMLNQEVQKIDASLLDHGRFFFTALFKRTSEIIIDEYSEAYRAPFKTLLTAIDEANKKNEKLFMKTRDQIEKQRQKNPADSEVFLADTIIPKFPVMCHQLDEKYEPEIVASTDSQGSFVPLFPMKQIVEFLTSRQKNKAFIALHCGDHVDRFGTESEKSNLFQYFAYAVLRASQAAINRLLNQGSNDKKVYIILPPGNHDLWHKPAESVPLLPNNLYQYKAEWNHIQQFITRYHLGDNNNIALQNQYFGACCSYPKKDLIMFFKKPMFNKEKQIVRMIDAQHSCFFEQVLLEDPGTKRDEDTWITWGSRPDTIDVTQQCSAQNVTPSIRPLRDHIEKNYQKGKNLLSFLKKQYHEYFMELISYTSHYGKCQWHYDNVLLIDIIQTYNLTTWCDFDLKQFNKAPTEERGNRVHNACIPLFGYLFLARNNYNNVTNAIQFFGHSHHGDQEPSKLINYWVQSPPYPLNIVFDNYTGKESTDDIIGYIQRIICFHKNKVQNALLYNGILPIFLPISPKTYLELSDRTYQRYYKQQNKPLIAELAGQFSHFQKFSPKTYIIQPEKTQPLDVAQSFLEKSINTEQQPFSFTTSLEQELKNNLALRLPYHVILSKDVFAFKSFLEMNQHSFTELFDRKKQKQPISFNNKDYSEIKGIDPQQDEPNNE